MKRRIAEILDIPQLQSVLDTLFVSSKITSAIIGVDGKIHTGSGWQDVCTKFHRVHPEARKRCIESDRQISQLIHKGTPPLIHKCPHGLVDAAIPIVIGGEHLGNVFTGQLFLEKPDLESFRSQARGYGFDEGTYIDAVKKVPIISMQELRGNLAFLVRFTELLVEIGMKHAGEVEAIKKLGESEQRFQNIFRKNCSIMILTDPGSGRIVDANPAAASFYGYSEDVLRTMTINQIRAEHGEEINDDRETALPEERNHSIISHRLANGEMRVVEIHSSLVEVDSRFLQFSTILDITERRQAEKKLREKTKQSQVILDNMPCVTLLLRPHSREIIVSNKAGMDVGAVPGKTCFATWGQRKETCPWCLAPAVWAKNEPQHLVIDEGDVVWDAHWIPVAPDLYMHYAFDITERKRSEERLKETTQRFQLAINSGGFGISDWDIQSDVLIWDERMADLYGFPAGKSTGGIETWKKCLHPEDYARVLEDLRMAIGGGKEFATEYRVVHEGGKVRFLQANGKVLRDANGQAIRMIGLNRDVTEHRKMENQLFQVQKMDTVGRLAGGIAHDFNNLLTAIIGYCDLALNQVSDAESMRRDMGEIRVASEKCASLTRQLLAFSRKQVMVPKVINLNGTVTEMEKLLRHIIGENIELKSRLEKDLGNVKVDPAQLEQVLLNLAVNARDAMPQGGKLVFESRNADLDEDFTSVHPGSKTGPHVMLSVSDTGCGMNKEILSHIFEPFFTTKQKGTGLGLSTVYGIVKQCDGYILPYSEPGIGTTIGMYFPRVEDPVEKEMRAIGFLSEELRGDETILLMEDEGMVGKLVKGILSQHGYRVIQACSDDEAIELCGYLKGKIHLLLTDVVMPGMGGKELSQKLTLLQPGMKVLFMSGYTNDIIERHGFLLPGVQFIQKPFAMVSLLRKVREVLDGG